MGRQETTREARLNALYEEVKQFENEIKKLHKEIDLRIDAYFSEEKFDMENTIDKLIEEAGEKMVSKKMTEIKIDRLREDM